MGCPTWHPQTVAQLQELCARPRWLLSNGGVTLDAAGDLYGTTQSGGPAQFGLLFKLDAAGTETILNCFTSGTEGNNPQGGVIRDDAGDLYEVTGFGGHGVINLEVGGVLYKVDASGKETVLYTFSAGVYPQPSLAIDDADNLYGTTFEGGKTGCYGYPSCGVVYKLDTARHRTVLYGFTGGADGDNPNGELILDSEGNLYGTTARGGTAGWGIVYTLDPHGNETLLYTFTSGSDGLPGTGGGIPGTGVIRDAPGNFYGTTAAGGTAGYGVVYQIDPAGNETVLYNFPEPSSYSSLILHSTSASPRSAVSSTSRSLGSRSGAW
jgi:uncharacterized repeat protein (TIGR03803 family)